MNKKQLYGGIAILVVAIIVSFYGGVVYEKQKAPTANILGVNQKTGNTLGTNRIASREVPGGGMGSVNTTTGTIANIQGDSMTLSLGEKGSIIIRIASSTEIQKMQTTSATDLIQGESVLVFGKTNNDGSISATSIQIRSSDGMQNGLKKSQ